MVAESLKYRHAHVLSLNKELIATCYAQNLKGQKKLRAFLREAKTAAEDKNSTK